MPLLALHRKDSGRAIPSARPKSTKLPVKSAPRRRQYGLIVTTGTAAGFSRERASHGQCHAILVAWGLGHVDRGLL